MTNNIPALNIRTKDPAFLEAIALIKAGARIRGWPTAKYLHRLALLHKSCMGQADEGDTALQATLQKLELETRHG